MYKLYNYLKNIHKRGIISLKRNKCCFIRAITSRISTNISKNKAKKEKNSCIYSFGTKAIGQV